MELTVHPSLQKSYPGCLFGAIFYEGITVGETPSMLKGRLHFFLETTHTELQEQEVTTRGAVQEWRDLLKQNSVSVSRYRHSAESLLRRVKKEAHLAGPHSAVDVNNLFSMQYGLPVGCYDRAKTVGNVTIRLGTEEDSMPALNGREVTLTGWPILADDRGPFGSPYVDSQRTAVTEKTTSALQIGFLPPSFSQAQADRLLESWANMFTQVHGGQATHTAYKVNVH